MPSSRRPVRKHQTLPLTPRRIGSGRVKVYYVEVAFILYAKSEEDAAYRVAEVVNAGEEATDWVDLENWETVHASEHHEEP